MMTPLPEITATGDERSVLTSFLGYQRAVARRKAEGLDDEQLRKQIPGHRSSLSIGAIIKHLGSVETWWARGCFAGVAVDQLDEPWRSGWQRTDVDWEWDADGESAADLLNWFDRAITNADATYGVAGSLDAFSAAAWGSPTPTHVNLRWVLVHLIEEYARHLGHLDLLREAIDGSLGD